MGIHHRIHDKQNDNTHATMHVRLPSVNKLHGEQSFRLFLLFFDSSLPRAARARFSQKSGAMKHSASIQGKALSE